MAWAQPLYHTTGCKMAHFARALQHCSKVAGVAATSVATATFCDAAINKKDFTPLIVARNDKIGANVHKVTLAFPDPSDTLGMTCAGMLMVEGEKRDGSGKIARPYTPVTRDDLCGNQPVCRVREEPASSRHRAGVASMAWRTTR